MRLFRYVLMCYLLCGVLSVVGQTDETFVSLNLSESSLQTGQYYEVSIDVENVVNLQVASVTIGYDPTQLYIAGTRSGSPVTTGDFMGGEAAFVVRNSINTEPDGRSIQFTVSRIRPQTAVTGSGAIGTFQIYPLTPGPAQLAFQSVTLTALEPGSDDPQTMPVTPVLVQFTINGDAVEEPDEATATPEPTLTPVRGDVLTEEADSTISTPTALVNITRAPTDPAPAVTATPLVPVPPPDDSGLPLPLLAGIALLLVGVLGFAGLVIASRRRSS